MDVITGIALAAPAGLNAYIPLLAVALAERLGWVALAEPFDLLGEWWVIGIIAALLAVEIIADKVPAVNTINDGIQTIVRPAAGGLLAVAASSSGSLDPTVLVVAGVVLAGSVHAAKASVRPALNAVSGGTAAPVASVTEDVGAIGLTVLAFVVPALVILATLALVAIVVGFLLRMRGRSKQSS